MNSLTFLTLSIFLMYVIDTTFGNSDSFKEYQLPKTHHYSSTTSPFRRLFGLSQNSCVYQCSIRRKCKSLNYKRKSQTCELNDVKGSKVINEHEPSVYMERSDIQDNIYLVGALPLASSVPKSCGCDDDQVCTDTKNRQCSIQECEPLTKVANGKIYGNMNQIGSKLKVMCNIGYEEVEGRMYTECLTNGRWQFKPECVRSCGTPEIKNAVIDTTASGTVFGSVATVTCGCMSSPSGGSQITCQANASWTTGPTCTNIDVPVQDCSEIHSRFPGFTSGLCPITPFGVGQPQSLYCDMTTDDGGWTVFQRRKDGSVDFYRGWTDYVRGFGDTSGEFWIGLDDLHTLTNNAQNEYELRIDLESFEGEKRYAKYDTFYIDGALENYILHVGGYSGDAGDSLTIHDLMMFSTRDHDNDMLSGGNCAIKYTGAWWFKQCHRSNLNGLYYENGNTTNIYAKHVVWYTWKGYYVSLKKSEMKIRRKGTY